ncbi:response regulator transcription factor [Mesorhizobium captivum]|uniref:response regulator transcription factor n=1 Tax=Mesorhizobium captivum TaxID=3072319 RepID=UPI002A23E8A2|nr:response regulator transcription factor [Mesorhizobium sp. VK23E]MDX8512143.1 response regulator transcription factor [Mesorhizobium sp. VK23E]
MRLLVIEDEVKLARVLQRRLNEAGFAADAVETAADGAEAIANFPYDAVILDLGLPDGDGMTLLREERQAGNPVPILVLTARDAVEDRVAGLNTGADDYLVKPFAMSELVARIKALLRRPGGALGTVLTAANIELDTIGRDIRVAGQIVHLPRQEIAILEQLMRRAGRVVPRAVLEEKLYGMDEEPESNTIPVHVHRLRKRLEDAGATGEIHTVRGIGYILMENGG